MSSQNTFNPDSLRQQLMSDLPMQRIKALHALEEQPSGGTTPEFIAAARFDSRGIPFYSARDPHYLAWVDKAVGHWQRARHA